MAGGEPGRNADLKVRVASAAVMLAVAGVALWQGGVALDGLVVIVGAATMVEFALLIGKIEMSRPRRISILCA